MTATLANRPLPELLGRKDSQTFGEWLVDNCPPTRGVPMTSVEQRIMRVPMGDDELSRLIRVHEMVHAKVSPNGEQMVKWVKRGRATPDSLIACEELRVNTLASRKGFAMSSLADGSEESTGERVVAMNDWDSAVRFSIATAGTAGHKKFLSGVRRHNRIWAGVLADVGKRAVKQISKVNTAELSSTDTASYDGLSPLGFIYTEQLATWIDDLCANAPKEPKSSDDKESGDKGDTPDGDDETTAGSATPKKRGRKPVSDDSKTAEEEAVRESRRVNPADGLSREALVDWFALRVEKCPMPEVLSGKLGKKRVASVTGKSPRRIHRMLTDPQRRVFDRVVRGKGGVVVIDASGSMSLTPTQIKRIVESAPGCTVLAYTCRSWGVDSNGEPTEPNCWVLADNGRMVSELPFSGGRGNGVDLPALRHALTYRKRSTTPFVWVSDCAVTGYGDHYTDNLLVETLRFVLKHNIVVTSSVNNAIDALKKLSSGERVVSDVPVHMRTIWGTVVGKSWRESSPDYKDS